jgi:hypothetical protein
MPLNLQGYHDQHADVMHTTLEDVYARTLASAVGQMRWGAYDVRWLVTQAVVGRGHMISLLACQATWLTACPTTQPVVQELWRQRL